MDLKSLIAKMTAIEEGLEVDPVAYEQDAMTSPGDQMLTGSSMDECGDMPMPGAMAHGDPKQQDNVTMNISMNGSGSGGIRDLMNILRDLEDGPGDSGMDGEMGVIIDKMAGDDGDSEMPLLGMDEAEAGGFDQASTTPDETYQDTEYMTKDLAGGINGPKDMYKHSYRQGDNPMAMETLTNRLSNLYQEVKSR